jgi:tetratricopeptide (TPR) repeat protein
VYTRLPELEATQNAVRQVEQMYESRCFRASAGQLGCISCHDPHVLPAADRRVGFYRARCLQCHQENSCSVSIAERRARDKNDSCIACHMPRRQTSDVAHAALTDHRILRRAEAASRPAAPPRRLLPGEIPLAHFHKDLVDPDDPEVVRDLGIALIDLTGIAAAAAPELSRIALPPLDAAVKAHAEDVPAWEAKGRALFYLGRAPAARAAFNEALTRAPERETTLAYAATVAEALRQDDAALAYWRRAVAANPWSTTYRYRLAKRLEDRRDWAQAAAECQTVLRADPRHQDARLLLIQCLAAGGDKARARAEFDTLLRLRLAEPGALRRWFEELMQAPSEG